jgi:two-component sensor histidine kinase
MTISSVIDHQGVLTNYVATLTDITEYKKDQQVRLAAEISLRNTLVREVHHRIKNNLQGVTGILHNFSAQQPEFKVPVKKAISQVQTIAVIHGLQGRSSRSTIRLCELTKEIADNNLALWHIPVLVDIPSQWRPYLIAETEAVPMALVLNELITNAIKHGHNEKVNITIRHEPLPEMIRLIITNSGHISPDLNLSDISLTSTGLQLIASLLPKKGAHLTWKQHGDTVAFQLELGYPVVTLELEEMETR